MVSHRHKFIFFHIPKTGGTSIETVITDASCELLKNTHHPAVTSPLNHLTLQQMLDCGFVTRDIMTSYFKFCIVRNPWGRAVSQVAYLKKVFEGEALSEKLDSLLKKEVSYRYANHVRPQIDFIDNSYGIKMDFIGRFENINEDLDKVCDIIGIRRRKLPHLTKTNHVKYTAYYDEIRKEKMGIRYAEDIKRFGYKFGD